MLETRSIYDGKYRWSCALCYINAKEHKLKSESTLGIKVWLILLMLEGPATVMLASLLLLDRLEQSHLVRCTEWWRNQECPPQEN